MAFLTGQKWYLKDTGVVGWSAVAQWIASHSYAAGALVRQLATPTVGNERVFACTIAGTSNSSEPTWTVTQGAKNTDNTVTWIEVTGKPGVNGDITNCPAWLAVKNTAVSVGVVIYDSVTASIQVCSTAGTAGNGSAPSFSATAGVTTTDNTVTWTSLGLASGFSAWGAPFARMQTPVGTGFMTASDTLYVSNNHAETQSTAMSMSSSNGTSAQPLTILGVNDSVAPPTTLATGATISTTGASNLTNTLIAYHYGLTFSAGSGSNAASTSIGGTLSWSKFENCTFKLNNSSSSSGMIFAANAAELNNPQLVNCNYIFGATTQGINSGQNNSFALQMWGGTVAPSGSIPTSLIQPGISKSGFMLLRDVDISAITGNIINLNSWAAGFLKLQNCKLGSGVAISSGSFSAPYEPTIYVGNCDNAATNYRYFYQNYGGTVQSETTVVRTGGATNGTTGLSWNITSSANTKVTTPFITEEIAIWNGLVGSSRTATAYVTSNASLNNNDVWMEIEYPSSSSNPLGANVNSYPGILAAASALTTDSSTWGGSTTNKYKMTVTFTPQMAGVIKMRIYTAKPSTTIYVDPYIYIT